MQSCLATPADILLSLLFASQAMPEHDAAVTPAERVIHARWVLSLDPATSVQHASGVALLGGRIVEIAASRKLRVRYPGAEHVNLPQHVLLPAFVNAYTQSPLVLLQGLRPRAPVAAWWRECVAGIEQRWLGPDFVRAGALRGLAEQLRRGTACASETYDFPEELVRLASELHFHLSVGVPIREAAGPWSSDARDAMERAAALWDQCRSDPWARIHFAPDPAHRLTRDTLARLRRVVDQLDAPVHMRVHDTVGGIAEHVARDGERPLATLARHGLLRPGFVAINPIHVEPAELDLLARSGATAVFCPTASLRLGSGVASVAAARSHGVSVALGSGVPFCAVPDMREEARQASLLASGASGSAGELASLDALQLITRGGGTALGRGAEAGCLAPDRSADICAVELVSPPPTASTWDAERIADAILFEPNGVRVTDLWIAGRAQLRNGALCATDTGAIAAAASQWDARLAETEAPRSRDHGGGYASRDEVA